MDAMAATGVDLGDARQAVLRACDAVGLVGNQLREALGRDVASALLLRRGRDVIEVVGARGSGRHTLIGAAHHASRALLGASERVVRVDAGPGLGDACRAAAGGLLVVDGFDRLPEAGRAAAGRIFSERAPGTLVFAVSERRTAELGDPHAPPAAIRIAPLRDREQDLWELIDHFFTALADELPLGGCLGFSRQARSDLSETLRETGLESVRRVRDIVRDIAFELAADGPLPVKITSDHVRPWLERNLGQTAADRQRHEAALVARQFEPPDGETELITQLAALHGVPAQVLRDEVEVLRRVVASVAGVPRSYRNIMAKAEDIQRAALWLLTGAQTQADFRRHFGEEGFMRPTKSVAWAFYNRVFQREP